MTIYMWIATVAWIALVVGYAQRRDRARHVAFMRTGIFLDFGLVLYLEVTRGAVEKALGFSMKLLPQLHIAASTIALLLYFPVLLLGYKLVKGTGKPETKAWHVRFALSAFFFRTLGFLLMFSMWKG